jgi:hypothetical protein
MHLNPEGIYPNMTGGYRGAFQALQQYVSGYRFDQAHPNAPICLTCSTLVYGLQRQFRSHLEMVAEDYSPYEELTILETRGNLLGLLRSRIVRLSALCRNDP